MQLFDVHTLPKPRIPPLYLILLAVIVLCVLLALVLATFAPTLLHNISVISHYGIKTTVISHYGVISRYG